MNTENIKQENIKVLVVEDEQISQFVEKTLLTHHGCVVDIANSAKECLDLINENVFEIAETDSYSLIFMDIGLPDFDGHFLAEVLRKTAKNTKLVPIVAVTGYMPSGKKEIFLKMGITDIVIKPLTDEKIKKVLRKYVKA